IRPLFLPEDELGAEAFELRRASLALICCIWLQILCYALVHVCAQINGEALAEKVTDMKELMSLTNSLLQNNPSCHICGIHFVEVEKKAVDKGVAETRGIRPLFLPEDELGAEAFKLRRASLALICCIFGFKVFAMPWFMFVLRLMEKLWLK
nr:hypothetical protein [Tanacetum cinerariifolium]